MGAVLIRDLHNAAGSRKRPLASQLGTVTDKDKEGRKSEVLLPITENDITASPAHQRRRSSLPTEEGEDGADVKADEKVPSADKMPMLGRSLFQKLQSAQEMTKLIPKSAQHGEKDGLLHCL